MTAKFEIKRLFQRKLEIDILTYKINKTALKSIYES